MDLGDALAYLDRHLNREAVAGRVEGLHLEHMRRLMEVLGDPHRAYPVIHVTGTNGKGSVSRMLTSLLVESGLTVGTYASPHLERINERISRNGEPISDGELAEVISDLAALEPVLGIDPSWFELVTAAALSWFAHAPVDVAVVEVGLLGRYDATNVVEADVAVITNVGFDHTDGAGDWRAAVAAEKAGIIEPGSFLILGETEERLRSIFLAEHPRQVWEGGVDYEVVTNVAAVGGRLIDVVTPLARHDQVYVPVHGAHQGENAAVALAAAEAFFGRALAGDVIEQAFGGLTLPGRFEVVGRAPLVILDGAHNPPGAAVAAATLADDFEVPGRRVLVVGMLEGKPPAMMLEALDVTAFDLVVATAPASPRALPALELGEAATAFGVEVEEFDEVSEAVERALEAAGEEDVILVTGSLYVVGEARGYLSIARR